MSEVTFKTIIEQVAQFHDAFAIPNAQEPTEQLSAKEIQLRFDLLKEENEEYLDACKNGDLVEIADALGDMLYILCGTILRHGLQHQIVDVFMEIQRSNMSKLGADGMPIYREDGKVLKGENYFKPNISNILRRN